MFNITYDNGLKVDANNEDWRIRDIEIGDIDSVIHKEYTSGIVGEVYYGQRPASRLITILLEFSIDSIESYYQKQREIKKLFRSEPCYLSIDHYINDEPTHIRVTRTSISFTRHKMARGSCRLEFESIALPYFESVEYNVITPQTNLFQFDNKGDIQLDDRFTDTEFELNLTSNINHLEIHSGSKRLWRLIGQSNSGDLVEIKNGTTFKNGTDVIEQTDKGIIKLPVGILDLQKQSGVNLSIKTKFYYE